MPSLFPPGAPPTWVVPQPLLKRRPQTPLAFPKAWTFDPATGDFAADGSGRVPVCSGHAAAAQRAAKAASTQQGAYLMIYRRAFGVDLEDAMRGGRTHQQVERTLEERIRAGITRGDRRARDAQDFSFAWSDIDRLTVTWTLVLADGTRIRQQVTLP